VYVVGEPIHPPPMKPGAFAIEVKLRMFWYLCVCVCRCVCECVCVANEVLVHTHVIFILCM